VENLIKIATDIYRAYFANGQNVDLYYSNIKPSQTGIKIKTSDYTELEDAYNKLRFNGILLIETDLSLIDVFLTNGLAVGSTNLYDSIIAYAYLSLKTESDFYSEEFFENC